MYVVALFPSFGSFNFWPLNVPQRPDLATGTAGITDNRNKNNPEKYGHKKRQQCFYKTSFLTSFFSANQHGSSKVFNAISRLYFCFTNITERKNTRGTDQL